MVSVALALATTAWAQTATSESTPPGGTNVPSELQPVPLPPDAVFERVEIGANGSISTSATIAGAEEKLVYSNTLGSFVVPMPANVRFADDLTLSVGPGCRLKRMEFPVLGRANPANPGGPYTVSFELFSNCPYSVPQAAIDSIRIAGTAGQAIFPDDAPRLISFPFGPDGVVLPPGVTSVWLALTFNRTNAGLVVGAPASQGFSCDLYDFPGAACNGNFGGYPAHAFGAINAQLFAGPSCTDAHVGYRANRPAQGILNLGAGRTITDDIELGVSQCAMVSYEVAVKGTGAFTFELRETCDGPAIPGTTTQHAVTAGSTESRIVRTVFDPPIPIPPQVHFAATVNNAAAGVVFGGEAPCAGSSEEVFEIVEAQGGCTPVIGGQAAALNVTITCAGSAPAGACCDMQFLDENRDSVCREVPRMNCPWPWNSGLQPDWVEGTTCAAQPFPEPCGVGACCRPDETCENLTLNECNDLPPLDRPRQWQAGSYCHQGDQVCPIVACLARQGDCSVVHGPPGCSDPRCCVRVCTADSFCCRVEWDRTCVEAASELCSLPQHESCYAQHASNAAIPVEADSVTYYAAYGYSSPRAGISYCCHSDGPDSLGFGSTWFRFVATDASARVSLCESDTTLDTIFGVYAVGDTASLATECNSLVPIACGDNLEGCGSGTHARICVPGLTIGRPYYVVVGSKHPGNGNQLYQMVISSPCKDSPGWLAGDCNANGYDDGCDLGRLDSTDCNRNRVLDECDIADGAEFDCEGNGFLDSCTDLVSAIDKPELEPGGVFGSAIAADDHWLVVGSGLTASGQYQDDGVPPSPLYVYGRKPAGWLPYQTFDMGEEVPHVAMDSGWIVASGLRESRAFLLQLEGDRWVPRDPLPGPATEPCVRSGTPVAIDGNTIAVGKGFCQSGTPQQPEIVIVYQWDGVAWTETARLSSPDSPQQSFGSSIAIDQDRIVVGASSIAGNGAQGAYVFLRSGQGWTLESSLYPSDDGGAFGRSVAIDGNTVFVGATLANVNPGPYGETGAAYVFRNKAGGWQEVTKLVPSEVHSFFPRFGWSVDVVGDLAAVSAVYENFVQVYRSDGGSWNELLQYSQDDTGYGGNIGFDLLIRNSLVLVGAPEGSYPVGPSNGSVFAFQLPFEDCDVNSVPDLCDLESGRYGDCNHDGRLDRCQPSTPMDPDADGDVDLHDFFVLQRCLTPPLLQPIQPICLTFDAQPNCDADLGDLAPFESSMTGPIVHAP